MTPFPFDGRVQGVGDTACPAPDATLVGVAEQASVSLGGDEDDSPIGTAAILLNGRRANAGSLVVAGTVPRAGAAPGTPLAGVPGEVRRELTAREADATRRNAAHYRTLAVRQARSDEGDAIP
ncbi:hypothetical protein RM844_14025 [Streptomyces sp. DSM 44915]|uniref:Gamma carbonic anhydrase family protein n=1 Tax=Streptomyces chisholmiae TaxID=3075540 RepID=A0ABU2JQZ6_9ACTN|nr:hypothetical protein [Streptomyces sp. DSM 44915]MDT0267405.1 hypothetical protein [Streptomyces sp. DSM 44915]